MVVVSVPTLIVATTQQALLRNLALTPTPVRTHGLRPPGLRSPRMCEVSNHSSFSRSLDTEMCGEGLEIREPAGHRNTLLGWPNLVAVGGNFQLAHSVISDKQLNLPCACSTGVLGAE
jgi:hypothetical protein